MATPSVHPFASTVEVAAQPIITLRGVKKAYHTPAGDFWALHGIDLDIYPGEFVGIIGKSGAGKTTLLNMISGIDALTAGEVVVNGVRVHDLDEDRLALWRGRTLGVITQNFLLMPTLTLLENVLLPMDFCGLWQGRKSVERARDLLRQVELEDHIHKLPAAISGGQQQRVAIARALANDPPILLADEPTGRLDSGTAEGILRIFERLAAAGKTIVMVTHDLSLERRFSRVVWIADGRLVSDRQAALG